MLRRSSKYRDVELNALITSQHVYRLGTAGNSQFHVWLLIATSGVIGTALNDII